MDWMYKDGSSSVDREEYLLGRTVDKAFEQAEYGSSWKAEIEKDCLPPSLFSNAGSTIQVDVVRKKQEDPLEAIHQREIEIRKQLLKNPIKLKKLQNILKQQQNTSEKGKRKEGEKKNKEMNEEELDKILAKKYAKLVKKYGVEKLTELGGSSESEGDQRKGKKESHRKEKSDKKSEKGGNSSENYEKLSRVHKDERKSISRSGESQHYNSRKRRNWSDSSSSDSGDSPRRKEKKITSRDRDGHEKYKHKINDRGNDVKEIKYGLSVPEGAVRSTHSSSSSKCKVEESSTSKASDTSRKSWKRPGKKMSEEEKDKKLKEMLQNAKWRDDVREKNVKKYREENEKERRKEKQYDSDFLRKQLSNAISVENSVESRIKSNINNIQRTKAALDKRFTAR